MAHIQFTKENKRTNLRRQLKFEEASLNFPESKTIIKDNWNSILDNDIHSFNQKILKCLVKLSNWNCSRLKGSLKGSLSKKEGEINKIEREESDFPSQRLLEAEKELETLLIEEELYWKVRSRED